MHGQGDVVWLQFATKFSSAHRAPSRQSLFCPIILQWPQGCEHLLDLKDKKELDLAFEYFEVSVAIAVGGTNIDIDLLVSLRRFIEEECIVGLCFVERGGALMHTHLSNDGEEEF